MKECNAMLLYSIQFFFPYCHCISYLIRHIISHIYAPILVIFLPFLKKKTGRTRGKKHEVRWRWRKTVYIIVIQPLQNGSDPFRHVKLPRSATATERTWDVTQTFLSYWTSPFNYTWENFIERWLSATVRKLDIECESALRIHACTWDDNIKNESSHFL